MKDGRRDAVLEWMRGQKPSLMREAEANLESLLLMETPGRLSAYRDLYSLIVDAFPERVWMAWDGRIHEVEPNHPREECLWCLDEPYEEAHLCPRCGGTGWSKTQPIALDPVELFLLDPVRNKAY